MSGKDSTDCCGTGRSLQARVLELSDVNRNVMHEQINLDNLLGKVGPPI